MVIYVNSKRLIVKTLCPQKRISSQIAPHLADVQNLLLTAVCNTPGAPAYF